VKKIISVFFFVTITVCLQAQNLTWDLKFLKGMNRESVEVDETIQMGTGQPFWITIAPGSNCYCYVIFYDSQRKIKVYDSHSTPLNKEVTYGPLSPGGPPGTETFYVIMSLERQNKLENLIEAYKKNSSVQNTGNLHEEVVSLQREINRLGKPPSSFIPVGGTARGDPEYGTRFSDRNMYVSQIRISH
jgi:hypothetical protein